jgi:hypothetical protein
MPWRHRTGEELEFYSSFNLCAKCAGWLNPCVGHLPPGKSPVTHFTGVDSGGGVGGGRFFSFPKRPVLFVPHTLSYPMGPEVISSGLKRLKLNAHRSPFLAPKFWMCGAILPGPLMSSWHGISLSTGRTCFIVTEITRGTRAVVLRPVQTTFGGNPIKMYRFFMPWALRTEFCLPSA